MSIASDPPVPVMLITASVFEALEVSFAVCTVQVEVIFVKVAAAYVADPLADSSATVTAAASLPSCDQAEI